MNKCGCSTQRYPHPAWIEIEKEQFYKNINIIRKHVGKSLICLPVKANAYGHGLSIIGKAAIEAGVDYLAVSCLQEGIELRMNGITLPILVLGAIHEDQIPYLISNDLECTVSSKFKAELVAKLCKKLNRRCRVHLEVDTGMHRTGVRCDTALELFSYLKSQTCFDIIGVYSHFATSDEKDDLFAKKQIESFQNLMKDPLFKKESLIWHMANSGGVAYFPSSHLDMVRPGVMAFGYVPPDISLKLMPLAPFFSLKAKVSYFKVVDQGQGISYGHSYTTSKKTRIITIPIGYGDGYRRALSNRGSVLIHGKRFPIVGAICMDQFMVDVGDEAVYVGEEVVLIGKQGYEEITLNEIADLSHSTLYETLCLFNERLPRVVV